MEDVCEGKEYSFPLQEEKMLRLWEQLHVFHTQLKRTEGKPEFVFYDGPPFATGLPHYGHILAGTIKDVVTRYQSATGHHATRRFGWDCHGLPVEHEIDKKFNINTKDDVLAMGIGNYNDECRSIVMRYCGEWEKTVARMGRWIDFRNGYKTLDTDYMETVWWVFKQLFDKGYVYQGVKVMPYSTGCTTILSNFEAGLNYKDVSDPAIMVAFPLLEDADGASMVAWTTTPWTLPSNLVLCVNAKLTYSKVRHKTTGAVYIVAESRVSQLPSTKTKGASGARPRSDFRNHAPAVKGVKNKGDQQGDRKGVGRGTEQTISPVDSSTYEIIDKCKDTSFKVVADNYVSDDSGTGVVHCAPAFGEDDYRICLANGVIQKGTNLPNPVNDEGFFTADVPDFSGRFVKEADKDIIAAVKAKGRLVSSGSIMHSYPFCWRSDTPLIYKVIPSWFVSVEQFKDRLVDNNKLTYWVPGSVKEKRFHNWLENARDWAVSRTRFWGTPLPIWRSDDGVDMVVVGSIQELEELSGYKATDLHRHHIDHVTIPSPRGPEFGVSKRVEDVFDCWFESGSMPYAYIHYPFENQKLFEANFPGDFVAEGLDQTRGWFYTLMVLSTALFDKPAFQNLICNGFVLAEDGKKMSKRLNNYPPPTDVMDEYGADALRLYLINSPVVRGEPLRFKKEGVYSVVKDVFLPWYNAYRFLVQNVKRLDAEGLKPFTPLDRTVLQRSPNVLDKWINSASQSLVAFVRQEMDAYRLYTVIPRLLKFIDSLTNIYVRFNRNRLKGRAGDADGRVALSTLYFVLLTICKVMAPFTPFFVETMYQNLRLVLADSEDSVHYCSFPEVEGETDHRIELGVTRMMFVIDLVRNIRERHNKPLKTPLREMVVVHSDTDFLDHITGSLAVYVREELNVRNVVSCNDLLKYTSLRAEPDYSGLGKNLGRAMGPVAKEVKSLTQDRILQFQKAEEGTFAGHRLGVQDIKVIYDFKAPEGVTKADIDAAGDGELLVVLDLRPDENLLEAGFAREIVNRIQKLRKKSGLEPTDAVIVFYHVHENISSGNHSFLKQIFESQANFLAEAVGSPILDSRHLQPDAVIIATEEYDGVANGSFKIKLTRPALSFSQDALHELCSGNEAHAENLAVVLRSRDLVKIKSELGLNNKLKVAIDNQEEYEVEVGKHFYFSVADHHRAHAV